MDIRNFFSKKKSTAGAKVTSTAKKASEVSAKEKKKRKEVSPTDFFGDTKAPPPAKRPSPRRSSPRRNANADNDKSVTPYATKKKATNEETDETDQKPEKEVNYFDKKPSATSTGTATSRQATTSKEENSNTSAKKRSAADKSPLKEKSSSVTKEVSRKELQATEPIELDTPAPEIEEPKAKKKRASSTPKKAPKDPPPKVYATDDITEQVSFDTNSAKPMCLEGLTFCFSGVLDDLNRDDASDMVKTLGGRVTGNVSSKTNYLVLGSILEDGRPVEQGSKYRRATSESTVCILRGTQQLYGLMQKYSGPVVAASKKAAPAPAPAAAKNPYAQKPTNPYAANPYAKKPPPAAAPPSSSAAPPIAKAITKSTGMNDLWVDKYKPSSSREILGNTESIKKLTAWLNTWEDRFNNPQASKKTFSAPSGPWKAALLSGPPGIGKTTTAMVVACENGRDVLEFNASDVRSKKALKDEVGDITGSGTLQFSTTKKKKTKRCIVMDEVDGMGAGDRSGVSELIQMIKKTKVPIICICNDRQSQKLKSLVPYCMDLRYKRPVKSVIARRAIEVAAQEGMKVEQNAVEAIIDSCGNDIRQVINCLQMWSSKVGDSLSYKTLKDREHSIKKDEILRVSLFDATRVIVEGRRGLGANATAQAERSHFFHRNDAYFVDYNFVGLMVHQNYLKVMQPQYNEVKRRNDSTEMLSMMDRVHGAAESMSDWALCEERVRSAQAWGLLPVSAAMVIRTGSLAGGKLGGGLPGFPEFTNYLGRISTRSKKMRLLDELGFHLNYKIQGGRDALRMSYLPTFRSQFMMHLKAGKVDDAIKLMDEYGLDRNDIFERFDEFQFDGVLFDKLDSKTKTALTRTYNQGSHKSQALVAEQGAGAKKRKTGAPPDTIADPDAIDDDAAPEDDNEDIDDEADAEKIRSMFKAKSKKGRAKKATATDKKPKAKPRKKKS